MLLSSSNRKYPPVLLLSYLPWLCAWDFCYITFCYLLHIHSEKKWEFVFIIIVQFMMSANIRIPFGLKIVCVYLHITPSHYHHCVNLSEDIELIKCLSDIFFECVSKIKFVLQVIHHAICGAVCFSFTHSPWDDREYIYFVLLSSSNWKYELLPIFRVRSWNNGMCCMSFYILMVEMLQYPSRNA